MKKKGYVLYALLLTHIISQAQVAPGDIAFVGYNADNNDQFTIITTNYLEDGTQIYFVDAGWTGTAIYASEGGILWTVPSGGVPTNTMVTFTGGGAGGFTTFPSGNLEAGVTVSSGTIAASGIAASMALTTNGDQILAFTGSVASPTFIAAANFNGAWSWTGTNNSEQSLLPPGLTAGTNCVLLSDRDNGKIDCLLLPDPASVSDYNNAAYWVYNDATRYTLPPTLGTCEFLLPLELISFYGTAHTNGNTLTWSTAHEMLLSGFEVQRSVDGSDFIPLTFVPAVGTSNNVITYQFIDDVTTASQYYYRLKMIDDDDSFTYSEIITISQTRNDAAYLFPNPVGQMVTIVIPENTLIETIQLFASNGSLIREVQYATTYNYLQLDVSDLARGMYLLRINSTTQYQSLSFMK
jgi:hypothetical protein